MFLVTAVCAQHLPPLTNSMHGCLSSQEHHLIGPHHIELHCPLHLAPARLQQTPERMWKTHHAPGGEKRNARSVLNRYRIYRLATRCENRGHSHNQVVLVQSYNHAYRVVGHQQTAHIPDVFGDFRAHFGASEPAALALQVCNAGSVAGITRLQPHARSK